MPFWQHMSCRQVLLIFIRTHTILVHRFLFSDVCAGATYVNTTGLQEERRSRSTGHAPLELRTSNPESAAPASPNELEPRVLLEPEGRDVCFRPYACPETDPAQGETPRAGRARHGSGGPSTDAASPAKTVSGGTDCDTG